MFNWQDYHLVAAAMNAQAQTCDFSEACYRSSLSRTYYAVFCSLLVHELNYGFEPKGRGGDHGSLRFHLQHVRRRPDVANKLQQLREWREAADYLGEVENLASKVKIAELMAMSIYRLMAIPMRPL